MAKEVIRCAEEFDGIRQWGFLTRFGGKDPNEG